MKLLIRFFKIILLIVMIAIVFIVSIKIVIQFKPKFNDIDSNGRDTEKLSKEERLKMILSDKNLSILGDSISTYDGYSNDYINTNSTIGNSQSHYNGYRNGIDTVDKTWWKKISNETNMNILVNNSWGGSKVLLDYDVKDNAGYIRANKLHDDTGENAGTNPDIIAIYLGINDFDSNVPIGTYSEKMYNDLIETNDDGSFDYNKPKNFTEAYIIMIHKIINNYENADVFCFTLLPNGVNKNYELLKEYNNNIKRIANHFNVEVVDLYSDSGIEESNYLEYSDEANGLHPDQRGMDAISETFKQSLIKKYLN